MNQLDIANWYIAYTMPFMEKKVCGLLSKKNIEHYCPMLRVGPNYSTHDKVSYRPLLPRNVFVHIAPTEFDRIKMVFGVTSILHWLRYPAIISVEEIITIKKFLMLYNNSSELEKITIQPETIVINHNSFKGEMVRILENMNGYIRIALPSLGLSLKTNLRIEIIKALRSTLSNNEMLPGMRNFIV